MNKVSTSLGKLTGIERATLVEYRGVPYAQPLEGEWRFKAPRSPVPWSGVLACERHAGASWQESNALLGVAEQSLDCLRLNLWVPKGQGPYPVMVWFHGGGYVNGSASQLLYDGAALAASQQVIVVNVGYRLGALGFGDFSEQIAGAETNLGLRDQIAALEWVQMHIADFGGDPEKVTIFGESAGGFSVACLLACERALPLFQGAIMQSGAGDMVVAPDEAKRITGAFVDALPAASDLSRVERAAWVKAQRVSYTQTVLRGLRPNTPQFGMTWLPQVDGDLLTDLPVNRVAAGSANDKRLLAGVCRHEWNLFQYALPFNGNKSLDILREVSVESVRQRFNRALPDSAQANMAFDLYSQADYHPLRGPLDWYAALETDRLFVAPTEAMLTAQASAGGHAQAYLFTHEVTMMNVPMGSCHVVDVPFVFGSVNKPIGQFFTGGGAVAEALSQQVQAVWGAMAKGATLDWPAWQTSGVAKVFGPGPASLPLLTEPKAAFWQRVLT